jgi:hypothetical protein
MMKRQIGRLHVYRQQAHHNELYIIGDHAGLIHLRDAIVRALRDGMGTGVAMPADGESYELIVVRCDRPVDWERLRLPYTADQLVARERDKMHPADMLAGKEGDQ